MGVDPEGQSYCHVSFDTTGFLSCLKNAFVTPQSPGGIQNWFDCLACAAGLGTGEITGGVSVILASPPCAKCAAYSTVHFVHCLVSSIEVTCTDEPCPNAGGGGPPPVSGGMLYHNPLEQHCYYE